MTQRTFAWVCPSCHSLLRLDTEEEDRDDEARGIGARGRLGYVPRCPMCASKMVSEDEVAMWYAQRHTDREFTLTAADLEAWRAEQPVSAHAEDCEVHDRDDADCGCGHDARKREIR
jgi:hypothetical protein